MRIAPTAAALMLVVFSISSIAELAPQKITVSGMLHHVMAIGAETTGWTIELDSETTIDGKVATSIQISDSQHPQRLASFEDKHVRIVGKLGHRQGVETGDQPFLEILSIQATKPPAQLNQARDHWLGRWDGPEGTFLQLSKSGDHYAVEIQDLDGPKTFEGFADGDRIRFTRDGKTEFISAGDGQATGMKWLAEKKNCLLTRQGEGWCRN
jgi:hypothetical protein